MQRSRLELSPFKGIPLHAETVRVLTPAISRVPHTYSPLTTAATSCRKTVPFILTTSERMHACLLCFLTKIQWLAGRRDASTAPQGFHQVQGVTEVMLKLWLTSGPLYQVVCAADEHVHGQGATCKHLKLMLSSDSSQHARHIGAGFERCMPENSCCTSGVGFGLGCHVPTLLVFLVRTPELELTIQLARLEE